MKKNTETLLEDMIYKQCQKDEDIKTSVFHIVSNEKNLNVCLGCPDKEVFDKPFYMASVGKLFTATLIGMLVEEGKLSYAQSIKDVLEHDVLEGVSFIKIKM